MPRKKIIKTEKRERNKTAGLRTDVYSLSGRVVGKTTLPQQIFAVKVSPQLVAKAVRVYQANERLGTHNTKTRSEVAGSTRKIYRQKGTGRARHGAITAPIFIGGGVAHGPKPQDYSLTLPQKMRRKALFGVLTDKLQSGNLKIIRGLAKLEMRTKKMHDTLMNLKLSDKSGNVEKVLLVTSENFPNVRLAGRNIESLTIEGAKLINTYQIVSNKNVVFMEEAVPVIASHFLSQNKQIPVEKKITKKLAKTKTKK